MSFTNIFNEEIFLEENIYANAIEVVLNQKNNTENELYYLSDIMFNYKFHLSKRKLYSIDYWLSQKSQYLQFIDHLHFDLVQTGELDYTTINSPEPRPYRCFSCKKFRPNEWVTLNIMEDVSVFLCQQCGSQGKIYYNQ
ncbi:hypothetical protein RB653_005665 [Dictyostelium firmibasis]|uniref:Uncharacterized protein n=1 Tax=Dictyostelium firmibasis TaxID=79012 RepID=A0AAN7ULF5_9MYCE